MFRLADGLRFLVTIARIAIREKIRYPAAALAYYAFVSFVPFLVLVFAALGRQLVAELSRTGPQFLTPPARRLVNRSVATAAGRAGAGALAVLVLLWSGVNFVGDIRTVVNRVEGPSGGTLSHWVRDAIAILGSLALAIVAIVATSVFFASQPANPVVGLAAFVGLWLALALAFVPLYYVPSTTVTSPAGALPGAVTASLGWAIIHTSIQFYAANAGRYAIYGVLSGVIIILTSLYLAAAVLLTGIVVNAQVASAPSATHQ